jgi:hypothetical protein
LLPMLKTEARPSKHIIVDASIAQHKAQQAKNLRASHAIRSLISEREDLLREVNTLRALCQPGACVSRQGQPIDPVVLKMLPDCNERASGSVRRSEECNEPIVAMNVQQRSLMPASSGAPVPGHMSHTSGLDNPPVSPDNLPIWPWTGKEKSSRPILLPNTVHEESLLWTGSPGVLTTTPPKDIDSGYDTNPTHLIDDSVLFWSQHPGAMHTTPPRDTDVSLSVNTPGMPSDPSMLWPPTLAVPATKEPTLNDTIMPQQAFQSAHSF